jgi:phospholipase/carboxylesterase
VNETRLTEFQGWTLRIRPPSAEPAVELIVLLHGWTGNEDVMWVFAHHLAPSAWVISPRGTTPVGDGFGWTENRQGIDTPIEAFLPVCSALDQLITAWKTTNQLGNIPVSLIGFSQGAALAYAYTLLNPEKVVRTAGLAGFLPAGAESYYKNGLLAGKRVFIAHGTRDDTVPIAAAERALYGFKEAGAQVDYCVSDMGHKLSSSCLHSLEQFINAPG